MFRMRDDCNCPEGVVKREREGDGALPESKTLGAIMVRTAVVGIAALAAVLGATPGLAKDTKKLNYVIVNEAVGVPVFPHDITDRPYEVLGEVKAEVRKATIFSKEASQEKIYRELWERGEKLGADAVIKASYGDSRVTLMSWGSTAVTGTAIKFIAAAPAPAVAPATAEPAATTAEVEPGPAAAPIEAAPATAETTPPTL